MMSILTVAVLIAMVVSMRRPGGVGPFSSGPNATKGDRSGPSRVKLDLSLQDKEPPGVVSYALMKDNKLPTPAQRAMRRVARPFNRAGMWVYRRFVSPQHDTPTADGRQGLRQSAELQNFLDARNREIARRKGEIRLGFGIFIKRVGFLTLFFCRLHAIQ